MKNIKKTVALILVAVMMLSLTACSGKMTAKKLVKNIVEASEQTKMTSGTTAMQIDMAFSANGVDFAISSATFMETKTSYEPYASYTKMETAMDIVGQQSVDITESYTVVEDGKVVNYVYLSTNGKWGKQETGATVEEVLAQDKGYSWMADKKASDFSLSEHEHTLDGKKVYVLSCTLTGDELTMGMGGLGGLEDMFSSAGMGDANIGDIRIPTTFYVDAETFLPVKVDMDVNGLSAVLGASMASALGDAGMTINVTRVTAVYDNISYEPVEVPEVPEAAYNIEYTAE